MSTGGAALTGAFGFGDGVGSITFTLFVETTGTCDHMAADPLPFFGQSLGPPGPQSCEVVVSIFVCPSGKKVVHTFLVTVHESPSDVHLLLVERKPKRQ